MDLFCPPLASLTWTTLPQLGPSPCGQSQTPAPSDLAQHLLPGTGLVPQQQCSGRGAQATKMSLPKEPSFPRSPMDEFHGQEDFWTAHQLPCSLRPLAHRVLLCTRVREMAR